MKDFVIIDGTAYLIKKVSKTDKAFECTWDYETGIMTVADEPSEVTIPSEKYNYEEMYKKLNVQYYIDYYANTQLQTGVTVTPKTSSQKIEPSSGYDGLADVTVEAAPLEEASATPTTESQEIVATTTGKIGLSKVTVAAVTAAIDANIVAGNIKKDVTILGVTGTVESPFGVVLRNSSYSGDSIKSCIEGLDPDYIRYAILTPFADTVSSPVATPIQVVATNINSIGTFEMAEEYAFDLEINDASYTVSVEIDPEQGTDIVVVTENE